MPDIHVQLKEMRTLIQEMGWETFMMHVGSLMAEQSDKASNDKQSSALFGSAKMVHRLRDAWEDCGTFEYPEDMINKR